MNRDYREVHLSAENAGVYNRTYSSPSYQNLLWQLERGVLIRSLEELKHGGARVVYLDFACGTGRVTAFCEKQVSESYGLDISPAMLEHARRNTERTALMQGDLTRDGALLSGPFDLITAFRFVLNAQEELRVAALRALAKRLRNGRGILVFNVHANHYSYAFFGRLWRRLRNGAEFARQEHSMTIDAALSLARRCGLRVERMTGVGFLSARFVERLPFKWCLAVERALSRIPWLSPFGVDVLFECRRA